VIWLRVVSSPDDYRRESRTRWGRTAGGWNARRDWLREISMPVSLRLVEAVDPQPGQTILELAAGTGDTGFLAAELIQPGGELITSDFAPEMLTAAQERARELGIGNVRFRQIDAESIGLGAASLDGVLCRWGYMLMADPGAALRETRRVLKPGARVALAAWAHREHNPWMALPQGELYSRGLEEAPDPDQPGPFAWAAEGTIAETLDAAGFTEHAVEALDFPYSYPSIDEWWATTLEMSRSFSDVIARLDDDTVEDIRAALRAKAEPYEQADGLVFPARTWVAWAAS
jgi:SAM-dependent methyltransferase